MQTEVGEEEAGAFISECPGCDGTGVDEETCQACSGSSHSWNFKGGAPSECQACDGAGGFEVQCALCEGRGELDDG